VPGDTTTLKIQLGYSVISPPMPELLSTNIVASQILQQASDNAQASSGQIKAEMEQAKRDTRDSARNLRQQN
jgi:hypothetical protein